MYDLCQPAMSSLVISLEALLCDLLCTSVTFPFANNSSNCLDKTYRVRSLLRVYSKATSLFASDSMGASSMVN